MAEELIKGIPALIGLCLAVRPIRAPMADLLRLRGPLDGVMYGVAAGATFTFIETVLQYVPIYGFTLLFPRVFITLAGHIAYAGIFGYFIGLSVIRPANRWLLLPAGWVLAAMLHALWNAFGLSTSGVVSAGLTYIVFLACLLKARQLDGQQGNASAGGGSIIASGSIVAGAASIRAPYQPSRTSAPIVVHEAFQLLVEGRTIPLKPGLKLELGTLPGFAHGKGIVLAVTVHPTDSTVLGLQNLGNQPWTAIYDGKSRRIDPTRNIRISHGTLIAFGSVQGSVQRMTLLQGETT